MSRPGRAISGFVAVVGTINRDVILHPDGTRHESLGGILYNAIPLGALLEGTGLRVRPIGRLGVEDREEARSILAAFPAIESDTLLADPAGTNLSLLDYSRGGERVEEVRARVAPLTASDLAAGAGARAWLVNMISGQDVACATLAELRRRESGLFLLDIQALARSADTPRRPRRVPDFRAWSGLFGIVRGSEVEVAHFGDAPGDLAAAARSVMAAGAQEVVATRGAAGLRWWTAGSATAVEVPAVACPRPVDPTGCGDSFLSAVCAGRMLGMGPLDSLRLGTFVASRVLGLSGLAALGGLRHLREEVLHFEPRWSRFWDSGPGGPAVGTV